MRILVVEDEAVIREKLDLKNSIKTLFKVGYRLEE